MTTQRRPLVLRWRTAVMHSREPASTKLTLLALSEFAKADGTRCLPSMDTLARQTSQSEKTCRAALKLADGRWFTRTQVKLHGREWRGYDYRLTIPEGAVTVTAPSREVAVASSAAQAEGAVTDTAPNDASSGRSGIEVRKLTDRGPVAVTDELGRATRKSNKGDARKRAPLMTFARWYESVGKEPNKAITDGDPIWDHAEKVGIDVDLMDIAWTWFENRYQDDDKTYRDWREVFRRAIKGDWHKCWRTNRATGAHELTEVGLQMQRLMQ